MTQVLTEPGFTQQAFDAFLESRNEPGWLADRRREAWDDFLQMSWPGRRDEEWLRTDIRMFKLDRYKIPGLSADDESMAEMAALSGVLGEGVALGGCTVSLDSRSIESRLNDEC